MTQLPIVEILLGGSFMLLLAGVFWLGRRTVRAARPAPSVVPTAHPGSPPARRLERDLSGLVEFLREFPHVMGELDRQTRVRQMPVVLLNSLVRLFGAEQAVVLIRRGRATDPEEPGRLVVAAVASPERALDLGTEIRFGAGHLGMVAQIQRAMDAEDLRRLSGVDEPIVRGPSMPNLVAAPMVHSGETLGVLAFSKPQRRHPREKEMLQMIAQAGAIAWHNLTAYRHAKVAADVDELTGIFNRRALMFRLSELMYEARQSGEQLSVFLFDIDHFKNYNDVNGHIAGDHCLRLLSHLVRETVRADDVFGRYGGEEFLLIMPGRSPVQALSTAGSVRQRIARYKFPYGDKQPLGCVTVSGGVATFPDDAQDSVELLWSADGALYRAKQSGRNQVLRAETGIERPAMHRTNVASGGTGGSVRS